MIHRSVFMIPRRELATESTKTEMLVERRGWLSADDDNNDDYDDNDDNDYDDDYDDDDNDEDDDDDDDDDDLW